MSNQELDSILIKKTALKWFLGVALAFLGTSGALVWDASAKLTRIEMQIASLEHQQSKMLVGHEQMREDIIFIRAGMVGPLRSEGRQ